MADVNKLCTAGAMQRAIRGEFPSRVQDLKLLYNAWARTIDNDYEEVGYNGPRMAVKILEQWLPNKQSLIMDVACGTGLVGEQLVKRGYYYFDGVDFSTGSIKVSEEKQIYRHLICDEIGSKKLDIKDGTYDAAVCVGCVIPGHVTHVCFPELARIVKPGGVILVIIREGFLQTAVEFNDGKFENAIEDLVKKGDWEVVAKETIDGYFGKLSGLAFVFKRL